MANENLCLYCFEDNGGNSICPHCGKDANAAVPQIQLLPGTLVYRERFLIGRALGQDASGIVYNALDTKRGNTIRIREYLPRNSAERLDDGSVVPIAGMEDTFDKGKTKLKASIESGEDSQKKHFYFEENGTAYVAQRRSAAMSEATSNDFSDEKDDEPEKSRLPIIIGLIAAIIVVSAVALLVFLKPATDHEQIVLASPSPSFDPVATWMPEETPTPTPYTKPTFAPLIDPELSWFDFTTTSAPSTSATATPRPSVDTSETYSTISTGSSETNVRKLQNRLVELRWMKSSQVTGKYDSATIQAVKDFQTYVNEHCSPSTPLVVDGIAGSKTQQWLNNASVALLKPTPTPTPIVTVKPGDGVINESSSASDIRKVQNKLIDLGLMRAGSADGKYGSGTKAAVRKFQTHVNEILGYDVLEVTGTVDGLTMAYMDYYLNWWESMQSATATPKPERPTAAPTRTADTEGEEISASSGKTKIRSLQTRLMNVGLLDRRDIDGNYGNKTTTAVKSFQTWINTNRGTKTVSVTGTADAITLRYLDYCIEQNIRVVELNTPSVTEAPTSAPTEVPTAEPTPEPTEAPTAEPTAEPTEAPTAEPTAEPTEAPTAEPTAEPTKEPEQEVYEPEDGESESGFTGITPESAPESITFMQEMLNSIGLLSKSNVTGVYNEATSEAIRLFQQFVNKVQHGDVLEITGICDADTQQYLQYAYDHSFDVGTDMGVDPESEIPASPSSDIIDSSSDSKTITGLQDKLSSLGLLDRVSGTYDVPTENAVLRAQKFFNNVMGSGTVPENGICDANTLSYLELAIREGWNLSDTGDEPGDDEYYSEPTETGETITEPTLEPVVPVQNFRIMVDGTATEGSISIEPGKHNVSWDADGAESYSLYLYKDDGALINQLESTSKTGFTLDTKGMDSGVVYEIRIGALPKGGMPEDMTWCSLYISLNMPEQVEPEPQPIPVPIEDDFSAGDIPETFPEPEEAPVHTAIGAPVITLGSSAYQQGGITYISDSTIILQWMADGDVDSYDVVLVASDGSRYPVGNTTDTSRTLKTSQLEPGMYTLIVNANPVGGGKSTTGQLVFAIPEQPGNNEPVVQEDSREASGINTEIQGIQMQLYRLGLLDSDEITEGVLDYATLSAVADYQERVNEQYGYNLPVLDPGSDTSIDLETLDLLLHKNLSVD